MMLEAQRSETGLQPLVIFDGPACCYQEPAAGSDILPGITVPLFISAYAAAAADVDDDDDDAAADSGAADDVAVR